MKHLIHFLPKSLIVFAIILLCYTFSCKQQVAEGLSEGEANAILDKILKVYNEVNLELVDEIIAPENKLHHSVYPEDIVGVEAFKNYITNTRSSFPKSSSYLRLYFSCASFSVNGKYLAPLPISCASAIVVFPGFPFPESLVS